MLPEASRTNNCISEQHLEMGSSGTDQLVDMPHAWNPNSRTYSFQKFFSSFVSDILDGGERDDTEGIEDKLDEMMMFDVEYAEDDSQIMENSSQVACENTESSIYDTKMVIGIIEEQYDVSILLDYLTSIFYTKDSDYDSTEDTELLEFLYDMDISKIFNDFDMFEKYQERNMGAMSSNHLFNL